MRAVCSRIRKFQVAQNEVRLRQHRTRLFQIAGSGGVKRRVKPLPSQQAKELRHKRRLQQRLPTGYGHPAVFEIGPVARNLFTNCFGRISGPALWIPSIRIMAVGAAQRAALQKHNKTHAWPIHCAHGLKGMHPPRHAIA